MFTKQTAWSFGSGNARERKGSKMNPLLGEVTDITGVIDSVSTYKDAAIVVGVAVLLFILGRSIVRKLAK